MAREPRAPLRGHDPLASVDLVLRVATGGLAGFWLLWWTLTGLIWLVATFFEAVGLADLAPALLFGLATFGVSFGAWLGMLTRPAPSARWCAVLALGESAALASYWLGVGWRDGYRLNGHRWPVEPQDWELVELVVVMGATLVWAVRALRVARESARGPGPEVTPSSAAEPAAGRARAAPRA